MEQLLERISEMETYCWNHPEYGPDYQRKIVELRNRYLMGERSLDHYSETCKLWERLALKVRRFKGAE